MLVVVACLCFGFAGLVAAPAQTEKPAPVAKSHAVSGAQAEGRTIPALFVSDIHFDPFHDPGKVRELAAAPVAQWRSILAAPASANQQQAFEALQRRCNARGVDTPFVLLRSSLQAMRVRQPDAKFMTVSGDLMAHGFTCRYSTLFPKSTPGEYQDFAVKTLSFVVGELRASFPDMPVYISLGNNDSGCGDYQLDAGSEFLAQAGRVLAEGLPASERQEVAKEFAEGGYYSVTMAEPMRATRLIVVNDVFLSPKFSTCGGKQDSAAGDAEMAWLERQLKEAREAGQKVWVMGHIPPGIDPYSTAAKFRNVCGGQAPVMFLASDKMADLMVDYADVMRLGVFAHTHMDEVRLLEPEGGEAKAGHLAAIKMVPSISPVDGNNPAFTVARVNPASAILENYDVVAASNQTGVATAWTTEYDYAKTYNEAEFSSSTVKKLVDAFRIDGGANTAASKAYIRDYFVGDMSMALTPFWPEYVCALDNHTAKGFSACVCSGGK
jgi:sphingomyelin phosphodiesterase acid-like 3